MEFTHGITPPASSKTALWLAFRGDKLLLSKSGNGFTLPSTEDLASLNLILQRSNYLGMVDGHQSYCAELSSDAAVTGNLDFLGLRQLAKSDIDLFSLAGRAKQIVNWDKTHQYCGACGSSTHPEPSERAKICPNCGLISYPRISPAIIVAVTKGNEILLARGNRFATPVYSVLAGFVEAGETLEECVQREVKEEVGIDVKNISYFGSQSWPFPNSLMVAFTAQYAGGEVIVDPAEIVDAKWFRADNLPLIPDPVSIAHKLIFWFCNNTK